MRSSNRVMKNEHKTFATDVHGNTWFIVCFVEGVIVQWKNVSLTSFSAQGQ